MKLSDVIAEIEKLENKYKYVQNKYEKLLGKVITEGSIWNSEELEIMEFCHEFNNNRIQVLEELKDILLDKGAEEVEVKITEKEIKNIEKGDIL